MPFSQLHHPALVVVLSFPTLSLYSVLSSPSSEPDTKLYYPAPVSYNKTPHVMPVPCTQPNTPPVLCTQLPYPAPVFCILIPLPAPVPCTPLANPAWMPYTQLNHPASVPYSAPLPCRSVMYSAPSPCPSAQPSSCILVVLSICLVGMTSLIRCCVCERRWTLILLQQSSVCMRAQHPGADRRHSLLDAASTHPVCPRLRVQYFL